MYALDVAELVMLVVVIALALAGRRRLSAQLSERADEGERRRVALTDARDALRARELEVDLLRAEWPGDVELRFPDEHAPSLTVNGLPVERGLRGADYEAVRENPPGLPSAVVLYLRLPAAPPTPTEAR